MANSPSFVQHALDLLTPLGPVTARSMFGGHGLYQDGLMFGLLDDGELFLKSDEESLPRYQAAGCKNWVYPSRDGPMATSYWQPPPETMEDPQAMRPWYELALASAKRKQAAKGKRKAKPAAAKAPRTAKTARTREAPRAGAAKRKQGAAGRGARRRR